MKLMKAQEFIDLCKVSTPPLIDVRAPIEFLKSHIPSSVNLPILSNEERAKIGIIYKENGQEAAITCGESLTANNREEKTNAWIHFIREQKQETILTCFRGGLRSRIAQQWLSNKGIEITRLQGGYKALRKICLQTLDLNYTGFVLTGLTGSGKTSFLRKHKKNKSIIDLELLANHRGSSFGKFIVNPQPEQAVFENHLAIQLLQANFTKQKIMVENESRLIGKIVNPLQFYERTRELPRVFLECAIEDRAKNIYQEYVLEALEQFPSPQVEDHLLKSLYGIRAKLGGAQVKEIETVMKSAFMNNDVEKHLNWIQILLERYYDPMYSFAIEKYTKSTAFRGDQKSCSQWLEKNLTSAP